MLAFVEGDGDGIGAATILSVTVVSPCHDRKTPQSEKWSDMIALHEAMETLQESCGVFPNLRKLAKLGMKLKCSRTRYETGAQIYGNVFCVLEFRSLQSHVERECRLLEMDAHGPSPAAPRQTALGKCLNGLT
jgi:hypothetical protein